MTPESLHALARLLDEALEAGASPRYRRALIEAMAAGRVDHHEASRDGHLERRRKVAAEIAGAGRRFDPVVGEAKISVTLWMCRCCGEIAHGTQRAERTDYVCAACEKEAL